jgi:hypothetical protein
MVIGNLWRKCWLNYHIGHFSAPTSSLVDFFLGLGRCQVIAFTCLRSTSPVPTGSFQELRFLLFRRSVTIDKFRYGAGDSGKASPGISWSSRLEEGVLCATSILSL